MHRMHLALSTRKSGRKEIACESSHCALYASDDVDTQDFAQTFLCAQFNF